MAGVICNTEPPKNTIPVSGREHERNLYPSRKTNGPRTVCVVRGPLRQGQPVRPGAAVPIYRQTRPGSSLLPGGWISLGRKEFCRFHDREGGAASTCGAGVPPAQHLTAGETPAPQYDAGLSSCLRRCSNVVVQMPLPEVHSVVGLGDAPAFQNSLQRGRHDRLVLAQCQLGMHDVHNRKDITSCQLGVQTCENVANAKGFRKFPKRSPAGSQTTNAAAPSRCPWVAPEPRDTIVVSSRQRTREDKTGSLQRRNASRARPGISSKSERLDVKREHPCWMASAAIQRSCTR